MGDVKLAGVMGLFLGVAVVPALFAALLSGSLIGVALMARGGVREGRRATIPFGPWLALGGLVGLFAGDALVGWYVATFLS
jgi:leader peptidase (prepilin peptidase)/N-methyltransferase